MKNLLPLAVLLLLSITLPPRNHAAPLIVDHTSVDLYTNLTAADIARVKTMFVEILGASHSRGYRTGCEILESVDSRFQVNVNLSGAPEAYTTNHLRISGAFRSQYNQWNYDGISEDFWFARTNPPVNPLDTIAYAHSNGLSIAAMAFGWSWQPTWQNPPGGGIDPVYQVRWGGSTYGSPDGELRWGLDDDDFALTGNRVSMDTYLRATQIYIDYCQSNNLPTKVFFTTGPPDGDGGDGEKAYQRHLKYEHIRNYVKASTNAILLDYADILCWSDSGQPSTVTWTDFGGTLRTIPQIHPDSYKNLDGSDGSGSNYHLGERGALRLAKALWYMLAQMSAPPITSNSPAIAGADVLERDPTNGVKVLISTLLDNDTDPDNDPISFVGFSATSANGGTVSSNNNWLFYSPPDDFTNTDSFTYQTGDDVNNPVTGTVTVNVRFDNGPSPNLVLTSSGDGSYQLRFDGIYGRTYRIQYTEDFGRSNWVTLGSATADQFGIFYFSNTPPADSPQRFYRSVYP